MTDVNTDKEIARDVFTRFGEVYLRGHEGYMAQARRLEDYYLGGGRQWKESVRKEVEADGRPCYEVNTVMPSVNAAAGYQIANRVDVSFVPRGGAADEQDAKLMSKVVRQLLDNAQWRFKETDTFMDGLIQQRGYIDVRMDYELSDVGNVGLRVPDPMDVVPDPDAKSYDPDDWADVHEARWLTESQIEQSYGKDAADAVVQNSILYTDDRNFGDEHGINRGGFDERLPGMYQLTRGWFGGKGAWRRYRIVERQSNEYVNSLVARWPTGDLRVVEGLPREHLGWLIEQGIPVFKRRMRRVRWQTCAPEVTLFNDYSPYDHFTLVPYFPYFRRGRTVGMVDNQTSVQDMLNKFLSQYGHVVNSSANGGWQGEQNILTNMTDQEFSTKGAQTGLILLRKAGTKPFEKIHPNEVPSGLEHMIDFAHQHSRVVSGVDENLLGLQKADMSGVAIQSLQYAAQQKLAIALSNLSRTRQMVVMRAHECVQKYMGAERIIRITEEDEYGVARHVPTVVNRRSDDGRILNDLTQGQYDLILNEQPAQVTFDNSQFKQMMEMRKEGIKISDARVIRSSNLADKSEIADEQRQATDQPDPVAAAEANLKQSLARKADNDAVNAAIEAQFAAIRTAREIVLTPQTAALADALLRSGGFKDADAAPIVPEAPPGVTVPGAPAPAPGQNTHPMFPANAQEGVDAGLTAGP